jgi:hypothetical protein
MNLLMALAAALTSLTFQGYVPPHAATNGLRYEVRDAPRSDLLSGLRACGIVDISRGDDGLTYRFAVTDDTLARVECFQKVRPSASIIQIQGTGSGR